MVRSIWSGKSEITTSKLELSTGKVRKAPPMTSQSKMSTEHVNSSKNVNCLQVSQTHCFCFCLRHAQKSMHWAVTGLCPPTCYSSVFKKTGIALCRLRCMNGSTLCMSKNKSSFSSLFRPLLRMLKRNQLGSYATPSFNSQLRGKGIHNCWGLLLRCMCVR